MGMGLKGYRASGGQAAGASQRERWSNHQEIKPVAKKARRVADKKAVKADLSA